MSFLFGKRPAWGMKLWGGAWLLALPIMLIGELIGVNWLFFPYCAFLILVLLPTLNILDGQNKNRGGTGIMWHDKVPPK